MKRFIAIIMSICTLLSANVLCSCNKNKKPSDFFTESELSAINSYEYTAKGTIIAYGGGFDQSDSARDLITGKAVELCGINEPNVLFIATGGMDYIAPVEPIIESFKRHGGVVTTLQPSVAPNEEIVQKIASADIIYETGGNLNYLSKIWNETGVNAEVRKAFERGAVLIGVSTGAMCWGEMGYDCSSEEKAFGLITDFPFLGVERKFEYFKASGILPFCICPHFDNIAYRTYGFQAVKLDVPSLCLENGTAIIYHNGKYSTYIDPSTPKRKAYLYYPDKGIVKFDVTSDTTLLTATDAYRRINGYEPPIY